MTAMLAMTISTMMTGEREDELDFALGLGFALPLGTQAP
jgi:hypothetical protein